MEKLPEPRGTMIPAQGIFLELLHLLVDSRIVTEKQAINHYEAALRKYTAWDRF
jgi:hypothetical protein